ncbi:Fc.00g023870.m01.CDS01 [Cosmosporella sp. VM-42]
MATNPELLYHTTLTVIDFHEDPSGAKRSVYVLATHATVEAAKAFAPKALHVLGYEPEDFQEYAVHSSSEEWKHGDGILVYAKAAAGQVFLIGIDTTPNNDSLSANADGSFILPLGVEFLHYVLQTTIDYNQDRTGCIQETNIEGSFVHRADAFEAARDCLDPTDFAEYDKREEMTGEWPFGEDVVVHAVAETGQNSIVRVTTVPGAHKRHSKQK